MIKARNKKISLILVLAMVMTMFAGLGTAAAADFTFDNAFTTISADDNQSVGYFTIDTEDKNVLDTTVVGTVYNTLYITVELPEGVEWNNETAVVGGNVNITKPTASPPTANIKADAITSSSVQYVIENASGAIEGLEIQLPNVDIDSSFSGNLDPIVTAQAVQEKYVSGSPSYLTLWTKSWTPTIAKVGDGKATVTAKSVKKYGEAPLTNKAFGNLELKENQAGTLQALSPVTVPDDITVSIETNGVEFSVVTLAGAATPTKLKDLKLFDPNDPINSAATCDKIYGTAGLTLGFLNATTDTINFVVLGSSKGIGGTVNLLEGINFSAKPGVEGDVSVLVSTTKTSKFSDTSAVVASIGAGEFTINANNTKDRNCPQGWVGRDIGDIEIDPNGGTFPANGSVEFTLVGAKWDVNTVTGAPAGWTAGRLYNNDRSIWYTAPNTASDAKATFTLPKVKVDADATPGPLTVKISGNAGVEGEAVVGNILPSVLPAAEKKVVQADAINQLAGDIVLKEFFKGSFGHNCGTSDYLTLDLPNGVYFAGTPDVYVNGEEVDVDVDPNTGRGYSKISFKATGDLVNELSSGRIDTVVIKNVKYDVDSRFAAQEIPVKISGTFFTGGNGSTDTIATVANAIGESKASGVGILTLGSTTYVKNGVEMQMDVAPYAKNNRTYMPIRYVANILGIDDNNIIWDQNNKTVTMMKGDKVVQVKLGSNQMLINGVPVTMDVPVEASNNRTF